VSKILKGFKYRIYPNKEQEIFLAKQFGAVRFVYNHFLARRKDEYLNNKKSLNYYDDAKFLTNLKQKDGYDWLYDINAQTLQSSLRDLDVAYSRFFRKQSKFPRFHSKNNHQSIKIPQFFKVINNKLFIPKLKSGIKIILHRNLPIKQNYLWISKNPSGEYYASFLCETEVNELEKNDKYIGLDLGLKDLVISSNGEKFKNHKFYYKKEKSLKFTQRQISKKKRGSSNRNKERIKLAKLHQKITNCRQDHLHKITNRLTNENQVIIVESLSVKNMVKNHIFAKSIQDASWGEFTRQLEHKSKWKGKIFHKIDRFFPSSKTCNSCQFVVDELPLSVREWDCPNCKQHHDRDLNAALNIRDKGLKDLGLCNAIPHQKLGEALSLDKSMTQEVPTLGQE